MDWTVQVGSWWTELFQLLENEGGLDPDSPNHLWLLHLLFLDVLNSHIAQFSRSWNHHIISIRGSQGQSPIDMFGFDMLVKGIRGNMLWEHNMIRLEQDEVDENRVQGDIMPEGDFFHYGSVPDHSQVSCQVHLFIPLSHMWS